jgi:hypothetical protein
MKVVVLHGSSNNSIFRLERNPISSNSKFELKNFSILRFSRIYAY